MASFNQAIKWMLDGKRVKRKNWTGYAYYYIDVFTGYIMLRGEQKLFLNKAKLEAKDWIIESDALEKDSVYTEGVKE